MTIGYAVFIYNDDDNEFYTDTYNYYTVPDYIKRCEIDELAHGSDNKCSKGRKCDYSTIALFRS